VRACHNSGYGVSDIDLVIGILTLTKPAEMEEI
jgi:hypothetical protein